LFGSRGVVRKLGWIILIAGLTLCLLLTVSRGTCIGTIVAYSVSVFLARQERVVRLFVVLLFPFGIWFALNLPQLVSDVQVLLGIQTGDAQWFLADKADALMQRLSVLWPSLELAQENPLFGIGFNSTKEALFEKGLGHIGTHNLFLGILVAFGLPALMAICWVFVAAIKKVWRCVVQEDDPRARTQYALVLGIVAGFLTTGLVYENYISVLFWLYIALALVSPRTSAHGSASAFLRDSRVDHAPDALDGVMGSIDARRVR